MGCVCITFSGYPQANECMEPCQGPAWLSGGRGGEGAQTEKCLCAKPQAGYRSWAGQSLAHLSIPASCRLAPCNYVAITLAHPLLSAALTLHFSAFPVFFGLQSPLSSPLRLFLNPDGEAQLFPPSPCGPCPQVFDSFWLCRWSLGADGGFARGLCCLLGLPPLHVL